MTIDIRTLALLLLLTPLFTSALFLLASRGVARQPGSWQWLASAAAMVVGWSLLLLRGTIADWLSIYVANVCFFCAHVLMHGSLAALLGTRRLVVAIRWVAVGCALVFLLVYLAGAELGQRAAFLAMCTALLTGITARLMLADSRNPPQPARRALGLWYLGCATLHWLRLAIFLVEPQQDLFAPRLGSALLFLTVFATEIGVTYGFPLVSRERLLLELDRRATFDGLTDTYNRFAFDTVAQASLARLGREHEGLALLMLDLDHFKQVNDRHGHAAGDAVLRQTAERLRAQLRVGDLLGRYGGEEFVVLLPATSAAEAIEVAERLRQAVRSSPVGYGAQSITVTISVGVAATVEPVLLERLYRAADLALYSAKRDGRDRVVVATDYGTVVT
ncbi:GGDEF domain-containing protein [Chitinimonas lacunae]|uniref:diguanylate cyclase n=1 Tax=Chitinimonas lacunae TaxID=1963018 RepID=A0ABV8MN15_9NEIS